MHHSRVRGNVGTALTPTAHTETRNAERQSDVFPVLREHDGANCRTWNVPVESLTGDASITSVSKTLLCGEVKNPRAAPQRVKDRPSLITMAV